MYNLRLHPPKAVRADGEDVVGETRDSSVRSEHGHLHVSGFVLTADGAARRRAAFELAREQNLFKWHIDEQDDDGNTALHRATVYQKILTTKMLLCAGADVEVRNHAGLAVLDMARGTVLEEYFLEVHAGGWLPLLLAANAGDIKKVETLLELGAGLSETTDAGLSAFALAALQVPLRVASPMNQDCVLTDSQGIMTEHAYLCARGVGS